VELASNAGSPSISQLIKACANCKKEACFPLWHYQLGRAVASVSTIQPEKGFSATWPEMSKG